MLFDRALSAHFESKEHSQPLNSSEKCLEHTRAMQSHFRANKQALSRQSSEKCLEHTRAIKSRFDANEQTSMPRITSMPRFQRHSGDMRNAVDTL